MRPPNRREFLMTASVAGIGLLSAPGVQAAQPPLKRKKALIGAPTRETLEQIQAAGFDGIESSQWDLTPDQAEKRREVAHQLGLRIHAVLRGWTNFNSPDALTVAKDIASVETALKASAGFGADALLLVPCRLLDKVDVPKPEAFAIVFDERTGHVTQVVSGDNSKYAGYMAAQNAAVDATRRAVEQLIPIAEKAGVVIALENVWSNLWVKPRYFANLIKMFDSPFVRAYFDIGNHVKYAPPQDWIRALGNSIAKIHVKDFIVERDARNGGRFVDIRDGDVNWPAVMRELDATGYDGWMTIEGSGGLSIDEKSQRLDLILAGE